MHLPSCWVELAPAMLCHRLLVIILHGAVHDLAFSSAAAQIPGEVGARTCVRAGAWDCDLGALCAAILPWDWACMNSAGPTMSSGMENPQLDQRAQAVAFFHMAGFFPSKLWDAAGKKRMG